MKVLCRKETNANLAKVKNSRERNREITISLNNRIKRNIAKLRQQMAKA